MATIDNLDIQISASTTKANNAIDTLVDRLTTLQNSLSRINKNSFNGLSAGIRQLNKAMKDLGSVRVADFSTLANNIKKITNIDETKLSSVSKSLSDLSLGLKDVSGINFNSEGLERVIVGIRSFGYKTTTQAAVNLPQISTHLKTFITDLNKAGSLKFDTTGLTNLINSISGLGYKTATQAAANLKPLKEQLLRFVSGLNGIKKLDFDMTNLSNLVTAISKLGSVASGRAVTNIPLLAKALNDLFITLSKAPNINQNIIDMTNALANLAAQGRYVGSATNSIVNGLNRYTTASTRANKSTFSLAAAFGRFYATYWLVIRGIKGLYKSIESTADYIEAFNYYNVAFDKVAADWSQDYEKYGYENAEAYADSFTDRMDETFKKLSGVKVEIDAEGKGLLSETGLKNLGLNIQEVTQFAAQLASVTNSVGLTGEASLAAADSFTRLAGDISSLFNVDYSDAAQNLQSGLIGQSRALYKYGIDITNATLQTYAYNLGLSKTVTEMTQAEKMQLRMLAILDQSKVAWGDLARTIESPSNQIRMLENNLSELSQVFGQLFMPILGKILPVLNAVTIALKRLIGSIAGFFGIKIDLESSGQALNDVDTGVEDLSDSLDGVAESAKKAKAGLRGFDELKTINMPETPGANGGAGGIVDLTDEILKATEEYNRVFDEWYRQMEQKAEAIADKIDKFLEPLKNMFRNLSIGNYETAGTDFSTFISGIFNGMTEAINNVDWAIIGKNIGEFLKGINWTDILTSVGKFIGSLKDAARTMWMEAFKVAPLETALITAFTLIKLSNLNPILSTIGSFIRRKILESISAKILGRQVANSFGTSLATSTGTTSAAGTTLGKSLVGGFAKGLLGITAVLGGSFVAFTNFFDMVENGYSNVKEIFMILGIAVAAVGAVLLGIPAGIAAAVAAVVALIATLVVVIKEYWGEISGFFKKLGSNIANFFIVAWDKIVEKWKDLGEWFNTSVITPIGDFFRGLGEKISGFFINVWDKIKAIWHAAPGWFNENVVQPIINFFKSLWTSVKKTLVNALNGVIDGFESGLNGIIDGINVILKGFNTIIQKAGEVAGIYWSGVSLISPVTLPKISGYYNGGFPQSADLFYANENGVPELVGTMGGRTAVASGTEITGIADAVYSTGQTEAGLLQTAVSLLEIIAEKEYGITPDALFQSVRSSAKTYSRRTGRLAFDF